MEPSAVVPRDEDIARARTALTIAQRAALEYSRSTAALSKEQSLDRIRAVLSRADCAHEAASIAALLASVHRLGRVSVHFHPDRLILDGRSVAEALRDEGVYRSQFETKISNGGLTAHPGGDRSVSRRSFPSLSAHSIRFQWEDRLFGSAYSAPTVPAAERPKYGALDLLRHSDGAAPRFGSCYLRLKPSAMMRATFSVGDRFVCQVTFALDIALIV